jgi:hypothetical protein
MWREDLDLFLKVLDEVELAEEKEMKQRLVKAQQKMLGGSGKNA